MISSDTTHREFSTLQKLRQHYIPSTPNCLKDVQNTKVSFERSPQPIDENIQKLFPTLVAKGKGGMQGFKMNIDQTNGKLLTTNKPLRVGCVLSGGQAAGGHNVIMGLFDMSRKLHPDSKLFGFLAGPQGIYSNKYMEITPDFMDLYRNQGGFDMIRSGRHKIETPQQFEDSLKNCTALDLDGLVVIGGDDSNTNACLLAEYFESKDAKTKVIGCPKTIDGDLKNEHIPVSFGFDTATKVYSEAIGNLGSDILSSKDYYHFIRLMGRSASHIALECMLQTMVNCVLIGEEVEAKNQTLSEVVDYLAEIICNRSQMGKDYGIILVPEGLIEFIPEVGNLIKEINEILAKPYEQEISEYVLENLTPKSNELFQFLPPQISSQLLLDRDPHGNVQVSKIDTEKLLILLLKPELVKRNHNGEYFGKFTPQAHFFGYEGRCALPSNFDSQYCYSLGMNATVLITEGLSGYMSCIQNLTDSNPANWVAAGCPLPTMMNVERRLGKDKPVIKKALVELNGDMFKAYAAVREKWAILDCYSSPGPIQFEGAGSDAINFMVQPPNIQKLVSLTERYEEIERNILPGHHLYRDPNLLSALSQARVKDVSRIPDQLERGHPQVALIKKFVPLTAELDQLINEQYVHLTKEHKAMYFVEAQDQILTNTTYKSESSEMQTINDELLMLDSTKSLRIGLVYMGRQAPGANNIVDGLLRFKAKRGNMDLFGFINGLNGLRNGKYEKLTLDDFKSYRNLGGIDFIGRGGDELNSVEDRNKAIEMSRQMNLHGLILVGATQVMTDAVNLSEYFLQRKVKTRVIVIPNCVDGNIHHKYIETAIGYDTACKFYSQLLGNMLTDSASAIKYWYFMRVMGSAQSHIALECALKANPNMVIVSEEVQQRNETLDAVVHHICDIICQRSAAGMDYGCIVIPEGLLGRISSFAQLILELNQMFKEMHKCAIQVEKLQRVETAQEEIMKNLTSWSAAIWNTLPQFLKLQLLTQREMQGSLKFSHVGTEKLIAHLCEEELAKRKKAGKYNGAFAPVTHFFGYQGRSAHPSHFDCSLASTMGYTAGVLIEAGLTACSVSILNSTRPQNQWRVGGLPLLALLSVYPKPGFAGHDLTVCNEDVDLQGKAYQRLVTKQHTYRLTDRYKNSGPVQFFLEAKAENFKIPESIRDQYAQANEISEQIRGLCHSLQNDCLFAEHPHLLQAAFASLSATKEVLNSITQHRKEQVRPE